MSMRCFLFRVSTQLCQWLNPSNCKKLKTDLATTLSCLLRHFGCCLYCYCAPQSMMKAEDSALYLLLPNNKVKAGLASWRSQDGKALLQPTRSKKCNSRRRNSSTFLSSEWFIFLFTASFVCNSDNSSLEILLVADGLASQLTFTVVNEMAICQ